MVAASGEAADTRFVAADALVHAFTHQPAAVRGILTQAVLVVDHPDTPSLIATAKKGVDAERAAALDELQRRFDASPLHR